MAFFEYIKGEFHDNYTSSYVVKVFCRDNLGAPLTIGKMGASGITVKHSAKETSPFPRVTTAQVDAFFVAQTQEEADRLLVINRSDNDFFMLVERDGRVYFQGKVIQDLGRENNKPFPRAYTIQARDGLNEVFSKTANEANIPNTTIAEKLTAGALSIPKIMLYFLELLEINEYSELKLRTAFLWTNERTRNNGYNPNQNYLAQHVLNTNLAFISGVEQFTEVRPAGVYGTRQVNTSGGATLQQVPATDTRIRKKVNFHTIGEVVNSILEALDCELIYDEGCFWIRLRELKQFGSIRVFEYDSSYTFVNTAPNFGATVVGNIVNQYNAPHVYAGDVFSGMPRVYSLKHYYINPTQPIFNSITRSYTNGSAGQAFANAATSPFCSWSDPTAGSFPRGLNMATSVVAEEVNDDSFSQVSLDFDLDIYVPIFDRNNTSPLLVYVEIFTDNGEVFDGNNWIASGTPASYRILAASITPPNVPWFANRPTDLTFTTFLSVVLPRLPNGTFREIAVKVYFGTQLNSLDDVIDTFIGGANSYAIISGTITTTPERASNFTGAYEFLGQNEDNRPSNIEIDRGSLLFENLLTNNNPYSIGSIRAGLTDPFPDIYKENQAWKRLNDGSGTLLWRLRSAEMLYQVQRVQRKLELRYRLPLCSAWQTVVYDDTKWGWHERVYNAATGEVSGQAYELLKDVGTVIIGNEANSLPQERGGVPRFGKKSNIPTGRILSAISGGLGSTVAETVLADSEVNELIISNLTAPIFNGQQLAIINRQGEEVVRVTATNSYSPSAGLQTISFASVMLGSLISDGSFLVPIAGTQPASSGDKTFIFTQNTAAATWDIQHNLGKFPAVQSFDSSGNQVEGELIQIDNNNCEIRFSTSRTGKAYLN